MMLSILFIIIPLLSQYQVFSSTVLLWSNSNLPQLALPLSTIAPVDIVSDYICQLPNDQIQLRLFAVNELKNEDIQRGSQSKHQLLLDAKNDKKDEYRYFPNVADDVYNTFSLISQSNNMKCSQKQIRLTSTNLYETLHDALNSMQTSVSSIGTDSNTVIVMALITGPVVYQPLVRTRRDEQEVYEDDVIMSDDLNCMFYAEELYWSKDQNSMGNYTLDFDRSSCTLNTTIVDQQNTTVSVLELFWNNGTSDAVQMTLTTVLKGLYWYLDSAIINDTQYRYFAYGMYDKMETPPTYSYVCTNAKFVAFNPADQGAYDFTDVFYITNFQFQPVNTNGTKFGLPNYCTSFFTSGIWMGITSSLLCLGILLFGVYRMMSIKSNDKFDDPKGKPLIIKAQE